MAPGTLNGLAVLNFRLLRDWTQAEAAAWYGCDERSWRRYETGERRVPVPLMNRIRAWRPGVQQESSK